LSEDENVEVVSEEDEVLYVTSLKSCKEKGLLHRALATFLRNSSGELLLQRRSLTDDWMPGRWAISSTGHLKAGEDPLSGSIRELEEELGIVSRPSFIFRKLLPNIMWSGLVEHELTYAFETISDSEIHFDPGEVAEVKFLTLEQCQAMADEHPDEFTPDAEILLQNYLLRQKANEN
jgi:isopentenyl-diphosphate Delta-isomerase